MALQHLSPILWTGNLKETTKFYENVLGFKSQSNFPNFASLTKDKIEIIFIKPEDVDFPKSKLTGSLFITTTDVDDLWEKVKGQASVKTELADREYRMRDFSILDNNGYELVFGQDIS